jgi:hypothetical protein
LLYLFVKNLYHQKENFFMNIKSFIQPITTLRTKLSHIYRRRIQQPVKAFAGSLSRRWQALKAWLVRKRKVILRTLVLLVSVFVAGAILFYLYRRSVTAQTLMNNLADCLGSFPEKLGQWLKRWRHSDQETRSKSATKIIIGAERPAEIPVRPRVNSPEA